MEAEIEFPEWVNKYMDIPYKESGRGFDGADCWGLYALISTNEFGLNIPSYDGVGYNNSMTAAQKNALRDFMTGQSVLWRKLDKGEERVGDGILLRVANRPIHVGTIIAPGWMLHVELGSDSSRESYLGFPWENKIVGFYRYVG